jgi:hypothetical protein
MSVIGRVSYIMSLTARSPSLLLDRFSALSKVRLAGVRFRTPLDDKIWADITRSSAVND